ncbi:MAG: hypothetical protein NUW37_06625 [Planctomycetes bacterium]|nr:hypothetical protein [Planctomycetota bacterium]
MNWKINARFAFVAVVTAATITGCGQNIPLGLLSASKTESTVSQEAVMAFVEVADGQSSELSHKNKGRSLEVSLRLTDGAIEGRHRIELSYPRKDNFDLPTGRRIRKLVPSFRFEPSGLSFRAPAYITIRADEFRGMRQSEVANLVALCCNPGSEDMQTVTIIEVDATTGTITLLPRHFSDFVIASVETQQSSDELADISASINYLASIPGLDPSVKVRLQVAYQILESNEEGKPVYSARLYKELGDDIEYVRKVREAIHQLNYTECPEINLSNVIDDALSLTRTESIAFCGGSCELIETADSYHQSGDSDNAAHCYLAAMREHKQAANATSGGRTQGSSLVQLPAAPDYAPQLSCVWRFQVAGRSIPTRR